MKVLLISFRSEDTMWVQQIKDTQRRRFSKRLRDDEEALQDERDREGDNLSRIKVLTSVYTGVFVIIKE